MLEKNKYSKVYHGVDSLTVATNLGQGDLKNCFPRSQF